MSAMTTADPRRARQPNETRQRFHHAAGMRRQINKVFPTHWSFMLGEIALYSFIVLLLSGSYLTLFFDPSMADVYKGVYENSAACRCRGRTRRPWTSAFEVRGGLLIRQIHHWAALLFVASMCCT